MLSPSPDDLTYRPVGAGGGKRRLLTLRHAVMALLVLIIGGGGGTAAYFLSDMDLRDLIGFLDIADPGGPKLTMLIPGTEHLDDAPPPAEHGDLLTPPGGAVHRPEPAAIEPPPLPIAVAPEHPKTDEHAPAPEHAKSPEHAATSDKAPDTNPAEAKPFDSKLFAGIVVPPPTSAPSLAVPPPAPRAPDKIPNLADLPERRGEQPLPPAPDKALLGNSPHGPVPVIAGDGRQPWKVYARPFDAPKSQPRIAVVVTDLGLDLNTTELAISRLPADVTLAFSPYALELARWLKMARDTGHEVLIILPVAFDTPGASDPGPLGLAQGLPDKENLARLETILSRAPGVVGVLAPPNSFLSQGNGAPILAALLQRGLMYVGSPVRGLRNPPMATITDQVDHAPWKAAIDARLALAQTNAQSNRGQVLVATPKPVTLQSLVPWLDELPAQGVAPAPVSAVGVPPG